MKTGSVIFSLCVIYAIGFCALSWAGTNYKRTSYFCDRCGMTRLNEKRDFLKFSIQNKDRLFQTGYSELYFRGVAPSCSHHWLFSGSHSTGSILVGGETGCGAFGYALRMAPVYRRLGQLDKARIPILLKALPLNDPLSKKDRERVNDITNSLIDIDSEPTKKEVDAWWQQNQQLFVINAPKIAKSALPIRHVASAAHSAR